MGMRLRDDLLQGASSSPSSTVAARPLPFERSSVCAVSTEDSLAWPLLPHVGTVAGPASDWTSVHSWDGESVRWSVDGGAVSVDQSNTVCNGAPDAVLFEAVPVVADTLPSLLVPFVKGVSQAAGA
jgi:hypothetical protein